MSLTIGQPYKYLSHTGYDFCESVEKNKTLRYCDLYKDSRNGDIYAFVPQRNKGKITHGIWKKYVDGEYQTITSPIKAKDIEDEHIVSAMNFSDESVPVYPVYLNGKFIGVYDIGIVKGRIRDNLLSFR